ncbi:hypothetical protein BKA64DRAFT_744334 [Cadophora sp. MPI-SDFR-AT-0126]|nr:hypothetical protein BKA64DRAFT_744334 [Leotiomycetes sp. MPI-SDFR-AT-0126]
MLVSILSVAVVAFTTVVQAEGFGLVGIGRELFEPKCCYSCLSSFWGLDLSCTDIQNNHTKRSGDAEGNSTSPHCHSTNAVYLKSLAYCINTKCTQENVMTSTSEQCWNDVAGDGLNVSALSDYLPTTAPTTQLSYNATTLQQVSLVNEQYYNDTRQTINSYVNQESVHSIYGTILIAAVLAFCILIQPIQALANVFHNTAPTRPVINFYRKHLTEPAFIGSLHLRKFPFRLGYIPSRILTLLIVCFMGLNAALCILTYPTGEKVDTWFVDTSVRDTSFLSNRVGVLSFANMALLLLFSGRNSPVLYITNAGRSDIIAFHRWLGRIATLEAIVHVALYSSATDASGVGMFTKAAGLRTIGYDASYWEMGEIAGGAMAIIVIASNLPLRTKVYEIFLFLHIALSGVALYALWNHITYRYTNASYGFELWLYMFFGTWGYDRLLRVFRIIMRNWKSLLVRSHPSSIVELLPGDEFIQITIFPSHPWKFSANQHCFLYFPTLFTNPFQSHPFTIAGWSNGQARPSSKTSGGVSNLMSSEGEATEMETYPIVSSKDDPDNPVHALHQHKSARPYIIFLVRPEKGITDHLHKRLLRNALSPSKSGSKVPVFMEGPYGPGAQGEFKNADTVIGIAGGIGITSITAHLQQFLALQQQKKGSLTRFLLVWKVREESMISAVRKMIGDTNSLARRGVQVMILQKSDDERRIDLGDLIRNEFSGAHNIGKKLCVVTCAPGAMADVIRSTVVACIGMKGPAGVELVEEAFAW